MNFKSSLEIEYDMYTKMNEEEKKEYELKLKIIEFEF